MNPEVALGSSKWLTLKKYNQEKNNTLTALKSIRESGYKIVATTPHLNSYNLDTLPLDDKIAVIMGTELNGLTDDAINFADYHLQIPMHGFTESYNISVSAALIIYTLTQRLQESDIDYNIKDEDYTDILINWAENTVPKADIMIRQFLKQL